MDTATTGPAQVHAPRPLFGRAALSALIRASHPEHRFATSVSRLKVGPLDREPDTATAWVYGAYAAVLGRLADSDGLRTYEGRLRNGTTPQRLLTELASSPEGRETATETPDDLDDVFTTGAYLVALGRRPDPAGAEAQRTALRAGVDHRDVLECLLRSPEAQQQLRFPPGFPAADEQLARAVQHIVAGGVDPQVHQALVQAIRDGRSVTWLVRTALRLRTGRRGMLRALPRWWSLGRQGRRRAETESVRAALESITTWNWRVQRRLLDEVDQLARDVSAVRGRARARD